MYQYPFYLLKTKRFLPYFITQFLGALNDNVFKLSVLTLIAFHLSHTQSHTQFYQAMGAGLFTLPFFLFSAIAGQLADKYNKAFLMRCIKCIEVILMIIGSIGIVSKHIPLMYSIIFLMGLHSAFFGPLKYSILPEYLQEKEWLSGNALVEGGTFIAILIGVIAGTILIPEKTHHLYNGLKLAGITAISIACLGAISSFFIPFISNAQLKANFTANKKIEWNLFRAMRSVLSESKKYSFVFPAIIGISWFWFMGASLITEFPSYVQYTLGAEKNVFTLFLALFSIGIGIGSILGSRLLKGKISPQYVSASILLMSFFIIDVYFQSKFFSSFVSNEPISFSTFLHNWHGIRISVDFFLFSIFGGIYIVPLYALIQKHSPSQRLSRMIAANNIMNSLFMVLSAGWIAFLASYHVTTNTILLSLAILNIFFAFYLLSILPQSWLKKIIKPILKKLFRVKINGLENYHSAGKNCLITINYTSFLDILLLSVFLPHKLGVAIDEDLTKKFWIKPFLALVNVYPITALNLMSARTIIQAARNSGRFVLFPEGHLQEEGSLQKIYEASGLIVRKTGFPILPIQMEGVLFLPFSRLNGKMPKRFFPKITINILPVYHLAPPHACNLRESRKWLAHQLFKQTTEMMLNVSPTHQTLFQALVEMRKNHGRRPIAGDIQQESIHYADIITRSFILGQAIKKDTAKGEYVGMLMPTMVNSMICFFALQAFGRIPAMLNFSIGRQRLKAACTIGNIKTVYTSRLFIAHAKLEDLIEALQEINVQVLYLEDYRKNISSFNKLWGLLRSYLSQWIKQKSVKSNSPAVILFTSGSEGSPKGVVLTHQNILTNNYQMAACVDFTLEDRLFNALPIFHSFGLTAGMLLPLLHGFSVFFYPSPLHYRVVPEWVYKTSSTIFLSTDTFLNGYAHYANSYDFHTVRYIFAGAEKIKEETMSTWMSHFSARIFEGYGVTEASPVIAVNNFMQHKTGTVGCLLPGIQYRLTPFEGISKGGRLWVSGPNVMQGYLQQEKPGVITELKEGWHDTGDIAYIDDEGYLTLLGRARRFAKIGGEMVSLLSVEAAVTACWPNYLHAVLYIEDSKKGEQLVLITNYSQANREELSHNMRCAEHPELFIPKKIIIIEEMPVLGSGKIDYPELESYLEKP